MLNYSSLILGTLLTLPGLADRGDCEPPVPEVVGKYMRATVVASLRAVAAKEKEDAAADEEEYEEGLGDDLSVCCHGRAAGPTVRSFLVIGLQVA